MTSASPNEGKADDPVTRILDLIAEGHRSARKYIFMSAVGFLGVALLLQFVVSLEDEMYAMGCFMAAIFLAIGGAIQKKPETILFTEAANQIVWSYLFTKEDAYSKEGTNSVIVCLLNGSRGQYMMASRLKAQEMIELIQQIAPHSTAGYLPELEKQYAQNPTSLLR